MTATLLKHQAAKRGGNCRPSGVVVRKLCTGMFTLLHHGVRNGWLDEISIRTATRAGLA
jgi:hypothetical protein